MNFSEVGHTWEIPDSDLTGGGGASSEVILKKKKRESIFLFAYVILLFLVHRYT